jgi:hypothetical protein
MKNLITIALAVFILQSCKKEKREDNATIMYNSYQNAVIKYNMASPVLDLDNDGSPDYTFGTGLLQDNGATVTLYKIVCQGTNQIAVMDTTDTAFAFASQMKLGSTTDPQIEWRRIHGVLLSRYELNGQSWYNGRFNNAIKMYLGIRIIKGLQYHYGWLEISHQKDAAGNDEIIVTRSAIETTPDKALTTP